MSTLNEAERLRAGARGIRAVVAPDAIVMNAIAEGLDNDAARLDRGEPVDDLAESLNLADGFAEYVPADLPVADAGTSNEEGR
jgi:hypothetical protein